MKTQKKISLLLLLIAFALPMQSQILDVSWRELVETKPAAWYACDTARELAEKVLLLQHDNGGWVKNIKMQRPFSAEEIAQLTVEKSVAEGTTIDNGATYLEMLFLSKIYRQQPDERYKIAFLKGLDYILEAQYDNGGWAQFYPLQKGYYSHITYNDNAMEHAMEILLDIITDNGEISVPISETTRQRCRQAFDKGVDCILKTQYRQNGVLTSWCAQYDESTLEPAPARSYELISLSGQESAGIVLLLMNIENPSPAVKTAINSAVVWFEKTKITGVRQERYYTPEGVREKRLVPDPDAPTLWARFMDLDDNRPFFCDRDGIKKRSMLEIGQERRNGYAWYSTAPNAVLKKYPIWKARWDK